MSCDHARPIGGGRSRSSKMPRQSKSCSSFSVADRYAISAQCFLEQTGCSRRSACPNITGSPQFWPNVTLISNISVAYAAELGSVSRSSSHTSVASSRPSRIV